MDRAISLKRDRDTFDEENDIEVSQSQEEYISCSQTDNPAPYHHLMDDDSVDFSLTDNPRFPKYNEAYKADAIECADPLLSWLHHWV